MKDSDILPENWPQDPHMRAEAMTRVIDHVRDGLPLKVAANLCGATDADVYDVVAKDSFWRDQLGRAQAHAQYDLLAAARRKRIEEDARNGISGKALALLRRVWEGA